MWPWNNVKIIPLNKFGSPLSKYSTDLISVSLAFWLLNKDVDRKTFYTFGVKRSRSFTWKTLIALHLRMLRFWNKALGVSANEKMFFEDFIHICTCDLEYRSRSRSFPWAPLIAVQLSMLHNLWLLDMVFFTCVIYFLKFTCWYHFLL